MPLPLQCCRKHCEQDFAESAKASTVEGTEIVILNPLGMRMIVCMTCGNKRCPKATDCRLLCTNSNEPGQEGSIYA